MTKDGTGHARVTKIFTFVGVTSNESDTSSSSQYCAGQRLAPHNRTLGDLEWEVESTTVTHSSADWWDLLLPLA